MIDNQDPGAVRTREMLVCAFNGAPLDSTRATCPPAPWPARPA